MQEGDFLLDGRLTWGPGCREAGGGALFDWAGRAVASAMGGCGSGESVVGGVGDVMVPQVSVVYGRGDLTVAEPEALSSDDAERSIMVHARVCVCACCTARKTAIAGCRSDREGRVW